MSKVSIIITTYNREENLKECIKSILDQTYRDFEIIVVDNYSKYNFHDLKNIINDKRVKWFQNKNNGIIAVNRNFGINKTKYKKKIIEKD